MEKCISENSFEGENENSETNEEEEKLTIYIENSQKFLKFVKNNKKIKIKIMNIIFNENYSLYEVFINKIDHLKERLYIRK